MRELPDQKIHLGVSWYPELWPEEEWAKDIARMQELGFTLVRLFEFAWKRFEPSEGIYDFEWALKLLDQLHAAGIGVMIGTPTAAPPAWLTSTYPEVLLTHADGSLDQHGKRKHYNAHSRKYQALSRGIVEQMAARLGKHPAVHSWQIDNEMSEFDYGSETKAHFQTWLQKKYGDIENLNQTWGLQFWSQAYDDYSQVPLCTAKVGSIEIPERNHPSLIMAIARFQNEGWGEFMRMQIEAIREKCPQPITSNLTGLIGNMDWPRHFRQMDRGGVSSYADLDHMENNTFKMDRLRPVKQGVPYWLLETAPNWSGGGPVWNIHHNEDGIRVYTWLSILLGGSMVLYWQWRSHWAGQEMQHGTCVDATGRWMPGKDTWTGLAEDFKKHGDWLLANPAARGPVGVMTSNENSWLFSIDPIDPSNRYDRRIMEDYYLPLRNAHYQCDLMNPDTPLDEYRVLIIPHMAILPEALKPELEAWVKTGGQLILGPMTGTRTEEMTRWTDRLFGGLEDLMGADSALSFSPHWVEDQIKVQFGEGKSCHPKIWCEAFAPHVDTEILATYEGGYGDGLPAVVSRGYGKGRVVSLGCPLNEACLMDLISELAATVGLAPLMEAPPGVLACPRVDAAGKLSGLGVVNTTREAQKVKLPAAGIDLIEGCTVEEHIVLKGLHVKLIAFEYSPDSHNDPFS